MRWLAGTFADLADLALPAACAGCAATGARLSRGVCRRCAGILLDLTPRPARPTPAPPGLPATLSLGAYEGVLREVLLAYKERGRHTLAAPLGGLLAEVIAAAAAPGRPLLLVPVPSTAAAARQRHGDHLARLARHAARRLRRAGRPASVARVVRALPRPDSAGLSSAQRAAAAKHAFAVRPSLRAPAVSTGDGGWRWADRGRRVAESTEVVVLDDLVTTGATLAAVAAVLRRVGLPVTAAAVLAATRRRLPPRPRSGA